MKNLSLILRIVAIVAALAAVGLFFVTQGKLDEKQAQLESAQQATQATQAELESANSDIASLQSQLDSERELLADAKRQLEAVRSEMYTARQEVSRTLQQLRETKDTVIELENSTRNLRADLVSSEQKLAAASKEGELAQLNERINELEQSNQTLQADLISEQAIKRSSAPASGATAQAAASRSPYAPNTAPAVLPASIGSETTIASISAEAGIIVLETTPELGLTEGARLTLIKDLKSLGQVQVVRVTDLYAVASILPGAKTRALTPGTAVKLLR